MLNEVSSALGSETGAQLVCTDGQAHGQTQSTLALVLLPPGRVGALTFRQWRWLVLPCPVLSCPVCTEARGHSVPSTPTASGTPCRARVRVTPNSCGKGRILVVQGRGCFQLGPQGPLGPEGKEAQIQGELPEPRLGKPSQFCTCWV